jgi:RimJ/RimL family protein N-acetyltransferase
MQQIKDGQLPTRQIALAAHATGKALPSEVNSGEITYIPSSMFDKNKARLETERLWLCPWALADLEESRSIFTDPQVMRYINGGAPRSDDQICDFITRQQTHLRSRGFCLWKLLRKPQTRLVGFCGLQPLELDGASEVEIGWRLAKDQWGRGFATEAARVALQHAVAHARLLRLIAVAMPENRPSLHIMEKLGMTYERDGSKNGFKIVVYARHFPPCAAKKA